MSFHEELAKGSLDLAAASEAIVNSIIAGLDSIPESKRLRQVDCAVQLMEVAEAYRACAEAPIEVNS